MKILSGGQTGADRAAFDYAIEKGLDYGGWVPKGRRAEDGPISSEYSNLRETPSAQYSERTRLNVEESDGTLIVSHGNLKDGSLLTHVLASEHGKPLLHIDFVIVELPAAAHLVRSWIQNNDIKILNVAGSRASGDSQIYLTTMSLFRLIFK